MQSFVQALREEWVAVVLPVQLGINLLLMQVMASDTEKKKTNIMHDKKVLLGIEYPVKV